MKQFGLSKKERVVNNKEFEKVYQKGTIKGNGRVIVRFLPNDLEYSRLGIAVSKKVFRTAVKRNRIKRLIREAFRLNKNQLPKGLDIIIGIRTINNPAWTGQISLSEIQTELLKIFTNSGENIHN